MKRLNCTYEPKMDAEYPWLLKHPKVKVGLAKFKTRQEALDWFMGLDFETAVWFQDNNRIFAGQLTIDSDPEKNEWYYYIKVAGFDGEASYEGMCKELYINPQNFKRDRVLARRRVSELVEGKDFILISDPYTYFPANLEISKRKAKDVLDVDALRIQFENQINILKDQLVANNKVADEDIERLKAELANKDVAYEELANKIDLLRQSYAKELEGVTYEYIHNLNENDFIGSIALYSKKLDKVLELFIEKTSSKQDFNRVKENFDNYEEAIKLISLTLTNKNQKLASKLNEELVEKMNAVLAKITVDETLEDSYANQSFYTAHDGKLIPVSWETSFVLVELKHVGFVQYDKYTYSIPYLAVKSTYSVTLVDSGTVESTPQSTTQTITVEPQPEPVVEEVVEVIEEEPVVVETIPVVEYIEPKEESVETPMFECNLENCEDCHKEPEVPAKKSSWLYYTAVTTLSLILITLVIITILAIIQIATQNSIVFFGK
ncbi:MAG3090 family protein [Mycoplasmopsis felifaucium]|uniref:Uncharacterized protein n=1 Tax=Mycoplasmopsis felifaucium TaxID=35768 RepID=A0ABZ2RW43_9BACT